MTFLTKLQWAKLNSAKTRNPLFFKTNPVVLLKTKLILYLQTTINFMLNSQDQGGDQLESYARQIPITTERYLTKNTYMLSIKMAGTNNLIPNLTLRLLLKEEIKYVLPSNHRQEDTRFT